MTAQEIQDRVTQVAQSANNNAMLKWVLGLMIPVMLVAVTWIFGAGKHYTDVCKIPSIEQKVDAHDKAIGEINLKLDFIKEGVKELKSRSSNRSRTE